MRIDPDSTVHAIITQHPWALQVLIDQGFTPLGNPAVRQVMAQRTTLHEACARHDLPVEPVLAALAAAAPQESSP